MTKKRCPDCKHTKGIGYDFWCGEGHTEYEVFIGETNCPYFEYHDWSKGTPSRTEKRFTDNGIEDIENQSFTDNLTGKTYWIDHGLDEIINLLNTLNDENKQLKKENSVFEGKDAKHYQRWIHQIKKYVEESNPNFEYNDDFIIKIALSYTLQSLRNNESLKRFQWL